jgi:hypothetical protein
MLSDDCGGDLRALPLERRYLEGDLFSHGDQSCASRSIITQGTGYKKGRPIVGVEIRAIRLCKENPQPPFLET